jgi:hypothetical protein
MSEVAEILAAERVVAHVLNQRTAVGEGMRFFQIIRGSAGESLAEQRSDVILPQQIDDLFVRQYRIRAANLGQAEKQPKAKHRAPEVEKSCHKASPAWSNR